MITGERPSTKKWAVTLGVGTILGIGGAIFGATALMNSVTAAPSLCQLMTNDMETMVVDSEVVVAIEAVSNSEQASEEASTFVLAHARSAALDTMASVEDSQGPVRNVQISVTLYVNGGKVAVEEGPCPGGSWMLAPDPGDAEIWPNSSRNYKGQLLADYASFRDRQLEMIAATVKASITGINFEAHDVVRPDALGVSPIGILNDITSYALTGADVRRTVGVLAPWFSTVGDCLDVSTATEIELTAEQLVELCVKDNQIPDRIQADHSEFAVYRSAHSSTATRDRASELAAAIHNRLKKEP